ncbi:cubilin-like [Ostrinia nubilalis]|uniref:cubilin-like n=1 Tax=Ostrinia nubilalis TaxID=29057 RepID=UPI0030824B50
MDVKQVLFSSHCYLFSGYPRASWVTAKQVCEGLNMQLASIHSLEEERFIISGIRQSSDYSAGAIYWLGAKLGRNAENFTWVDGTAVGYQGWPPYNETEDSEDECLGVQWKSSPIPSQPSGLYWTLHRCGTTGGYVCKRKLNPEHVVRNRTVEGTSGELSSPNHPSHYDNDLDYWVHVGGPPDTRLVFVFRKIELEYQKDCLYDFIELRDPLSQKSSRYCGSVGETRWVAGGNKADLHFHSDYNTQGAGFSLTWDAVELIGCPSQTFTSKEGVLRSPNYPHFLLPNLDCTIDILAPAGKRVFLNISHFDFGYGTFDKGVPYNVTDSVPEDSFLEVQVDLQTMPIRPFLNQKILTNGLFVSQSEILRLRLRTGENVTGIGFMAHFKTVGFLNLSHVVELRSARGGRLAPPNYPGAAPSQALVRARILAPPRHTLAIALHAARLATPPVAEDEDSKSEPCGENNGWIEVSSMKPNAALTQALIRARLLAPPRHTLAIALHAARLATPPVAEDEDSKNEPCGENNGWIEVSLSPQGHTLAIALHAARLATPPVADDEDSKNEPCGENNGWIEVCSMKPSAALTQALIRARLLAPPRHTLAIALHAARLATPPVAEDEDSKNEPCGENNG